MEIEIGEINSELYGKLDSRKILIPIFLPTGKPVIGEALKNENLLKSLVETNLAKIRHIFEEDDDETIKAKIKDSIIHLAHIDSEISIDSPVYSVLVTAAIGVFHPVEHDEIIKQAEELDFELEAKLLFKHYNNFYTKIKNGENTEELFDSMKAMLSFSSEQIKFVEKGIADGRSTISNYDEYHREVHVAGIRKGLCIFLTLENNGYNNTTLDTLYSEIISYHELITLILRIRNVKLSPSFKDCFLVEHLKSQLNLARRILKDIIDLKNDVFNGDPAKLKENAILRLVISSLNTRQNLGNGPYEIFQNELDSEEIDLNKAFNIRLKHLYSVLKDINAVSNTLSNAYEADENVQEYLEILKQCWDAELFSLKYINTHKTKLIGVPFV